MTTRSTYVWNGSTWDEIGIAVVGIRANTTPQTAAITSSSLANLATQKTTVTIDQAYRVLKVQTDRAARVRLYTTTTARDADESRAAGTDPADNAGVLMDVVTTGDMLTISLSPVVDGWLASGTSVPISITNRSGSTSTVVVTLTYV